MVVSLKGGASGAEALMYMKSGTGDANRVLIAYSLIYMLPISAKIPFNWRELTPVALVALDQFVLWDNTTYPRRRLKDFISAAKSANPPFKMGGTGSRREDQVLSVFVEKKTGAKFAYLPYKSGGEAATQLVGNHTQANVNNPSENLEVWRAGQVRALCVRQGAHPVQDQGHRQAILERHPDLQGRGTGRAVPDAAGDVPPGKSDAGAEGVLRRSLQEGVADRRLQGLHGKAARSSPPSSPATRCRNSSRKTTRSTRA